MAKKEDFVLVENKDLLKVQKTLAQASVALQAANSAINALTGVGAPKAARKPRAPKAEAPATPAAEPQDFDDAPKSTSTSTAVVTGPKKGASVVAIRDGKVASKHVVTKKGFAPAMPGKKVG